MMMTAKGVKRVKRSLLRNPFRQQRRRVNDEVERENEMGQQ
jgi:hypothetical protein